MAVRYNTRWIEILQEAIRYYYANNFARVQYFSERRN